MFGDLGRVRSSLTNRTETPFPPPILAPTNTTLSVPPVGSFPNAVSNYNGSLTPEPQPTNDPLSNAVARAMEAPPVIRPPETSLPPLVAPPGTGPTNFPGIAIAASGPPQSQAPAPALSPAPAPVEPYIPRTSEPGSKESTAALLAATEGYTPPEPTDMGARPTSSLLGGANQSASNAVPGVSAHWPSAANATNFSFVIDQSLSMARDGKTARAQGELLKILETVGPESTFYVLLFHSGGYEGMPGFGPVPATPDNIRAMSSWLFSAGHRFGSDPSKGMRRALHMVPAPNVVWLISGGDFRAVPFKPFAKPTKASTPRSILLILTIRKANRRCGKLPRRIAARFASFPFHEPIAPQDAGCCHCDGHHRRASGLVAAPHAPP